jgi:hypothetical protein
MRDIETIDGELRLLAPRVAGRSPLEWLHAKHCAHRRAAGRALGNYGLEHHSCGGCMAQTTTQLSATNGVRNCAR